MKPVASRQISARRAGGVVGAIRGIRARPAATARRALRPPPRAAGRGRSCPPFPHRQLLRIALGAAREDHVRVDHRDHGDAVGDGATRLEDRVERRAGGKRLRRGRVDHRTVGERVGERDAELDQVRARIRVRLDDRARRPGVWEAAHEVRHQRSAPLPPRRLERRGDPLGAVIPFAPGRCGRSRGVELGQARRDLGEVLVAAAAQGQEVVAASRADSARRRGAMRSHGLDSSAGIRPSRRAVSRNASSASVSVTDT